MERRTARYLALMAGNGAVLLTMTQAILEKPAYMAGRHELWGLVGMAAFGVATGYLALLYIETKWSARNAELWSAVAFVATVGYWVKFLALD